MIYDSIRSPQTCFACSGTHFLLDFGGRLISNHMFFHCKSCGVAVAVPREGIVTCDFSQYGDYLTHDVSGRLRHAKMMHWPFFRNVEKCYGQKAKILDIGAGAGYFLKAASEYGFQVAGVEPSSKLREFSEKNLGIVLHPTAQSLPSDFDVICTLDVIEHIPSNEHRGFMHQILMKLRHGGSYYGNTPNYRSANVMLFRERDPAIWPPSHCTYFNLQALDFYFASLNLKRDFLYTKGFVPFRSQKAKPSFIDQPCRSKLVRLSAVYPSKVLLRLLSAISSPFGLGYQIYYCYRKP